MPTLAQASNFEAAFVVIGTLVLIGAPVLYWIFFKMDAGPSVEVPDEPAVSLTVENLSQIERELGVSLPLSYAAFQQNREAHPHVDNTTVMDCAAHIIEATQEMRLERKWPAPWLCVGDEADVCYYALNCETGEFIQTHKGRMDQPPLKQHPSFDDFVQTREAERAAEED